MSPVSIVSDVPGLDPGPDPPRGRPGPPPFPGISARIKSSEAREWDAGTATPTRKGQQGYPRRNAPRKRGRVRGTAPGELRAGGAVRVPPPKHDPAPSTTYRRSTTHGRSY